MSSESIHSSEREAQAGESFAALAQMLPEGGELLLESDTVTYFYGRPVGRPVPISYEALDTLRLTGVRQHSRPINDELRDGARRRFAQRGIALTPAATYPVLTLVNSDTKQQAQSVIDVTELVLGDSIEVVSSGGTRGGEYLQVRLDNLVEDLARRIGIVAQRAIVLDDDDSVQQLGFSLPVEEVYVGALETVNTQTLQVEVERRSEMVIDLLQMSVGWSFQQNPYEIGDEGVALRLAELPNMETCIAELIHFIELRGRTLTLSKMYAPKEGESFCYGFKRGDDATMPLYADPDLTMATYGAYRAAKQLFGI